MRNSGQAIGKRDRLPPERRGVILADLVSCGRTQAPHQRPAGHSHPRVHAPGVAVTATAQERSHASPATAIAITRCDGRDSTGVRYPAFVAAAPVVVSINSATQNGQIHAAPPAQIRQLTLPHLAEMSVQTLARISCCGPRRDVGSV